MFHVKHINNKMYEILLKLSEKSSKNGDIPVSSIIVLNKKIIGKGYNNRHKKKNVLGHAEINAIKDATTNLGDWRLNGCDLYVTLEPCDMCIEVIKESRIDNIYFLLENKDKHKYNRTNKCTLAYDESVVNNYKEKLSNFFDKNLNR